jgi:hypothetical protein
MKLVVTEPVKSFFIKDSETLINISSIRHHLDPNATVTQYRVDWIDSAVNVCSLRYDDINSPHFKVLNQVELHAQFGAADIFQINDLLSSLETFLQIYPGFGDITRLLESDKTVI